MPPELSTEQTSQVEDPSTPRYEELSLEARTRIEELEREYFDRQHSEHLDGEVLEMLLCSLLELFPDAPASALNEGGIMIAMPESVPLERNPVLEARAGVDLLVFDHKLVSAWDRTLGGGAARCSFTPTGHPEISGTLYMLDLRERHGALVTFAVYDQEAARSGQPVAAELPEVTPRFATVLKDARGVIVKIDEAITKILGWGGEEIEGHRSIEFIHPDDTALAVDNWMQMLAFPGPGRRVRLRHRRKDDTWVWFEITNHNQLSDPQQSVVVSEMVDISEEMAAHEELRAREQLLDRLAEAAPVGLLQFDAEHNVIYTNDRLHQIVGVERVDTVEAQLSAVLEHDAPVLAQALEDVLNDGEQADVEVELCMPEGNERRSCAIGLRALSDEAGTITGAIACIADVTDSARLREELQSRATFDALTGCHNRASVMQTLDRYIAGEQRSADRAVVFVDLDGFKEVNDRHSHAVGDEVLSVVAGRLRGAVRKADVVGRIGGDEFLVVCPDIGGPRQAMALARRMARAQCEQMCLSDGTLTLQVSIGVAYSDDDTLDAEALVGLADQAMYESKRERRGQPKLAGERAETPVVPRQLTLRQAIDVACDRRPARADAHELELRASSVGALLSALQARDGYTEDHSQAVVGLAVAAGRELGLDEHQLHDLEIVALLHDVGKIGIADAVLRKPGALDEEEWAEMHRHPDIGADIVAAMPSLAYLAPVIRAEHERWDGGGYPNGLQGEEIPLLSRIVFVCDAYHAMTSDRPYRRALTATAALKEIGANRGSQFCPSAATALTVVLKRMRARPARPRRVPAGRSQRKRARSAAG